jgi:hypothetical protein
MEPASHNKSSVQLHRQLANLKIVTRLLAHELHSQSTSKAITLSRDEVQEIQTSLELFIEEVMRKTGVGGGQTTDVSALPNASGATSGPALIAVGNSRL